MTSHPPHPSAQSPEGAKRPAARRTAIASPDMRAWMISLLFALCMGLVPVGGWASCTMTANSSPLDNGVIVLYFPVFSVSVDATRQDGSVLHTQNSTLSPSTGQHQCDYTFSYHTYVTTGSPVPGYTKVYSTSISGIGMRVSTTVVYPNEETVQHYPSQGLIQNTNSQGGNQQMKIELIKTGPITAGGTLTGEFLALFAVGAAETNQITSFRFNGGITILPNVPTCTVKTPFIAVDMGTVAAGDFQGTGTNAGAKVPFFIELSCSDGAANTSTNVHITLTDNTDPTNIGEVLSLTPGPTAASGIGLNIFKGGTTEKVKFGPDSSAAGNLNQWFAGQVNVGTTSFSIPLSAQYVQTGPTVTAGTANAVATFTISYQ